MPRLVRGTNREERDRNNYENGERLIDFVTANRMIAVDELELEAIKMQLCLHFCNVC